MLHRMISYLSTLIYRVCYDVIANSNDQLVEYVSGDLFSEVKYDKIARDRQCHALCYVAAQKYSFPEVVIGRNDSVDQECLL